MKITKTYLKIALLSVGLFFASCNKDEGKEPVAPKGAYENGIFVTGEGAGANSGSISFVANDLSKSENKIFKKINKADLGIYLQSLAFDNDRAYIVVDNQNTITVVNRYTFEKVGAITSKLVKPRFMTISNGKGYVTNWGDTSKNDDDFVAVVNLQTLTVEKTIPVALGPERIIANKGKLYVSHKGAFGTNNIVSVIDVATNKVEKKIKVQDKPDELLLDSTGKLVVLCEGKTIYDSNWAVTGHTKASISYINTSNNTLDRELTFVEGVHPSQMVLNGAKLYYSVGKKVFETNVNTTSLPTTHLFEADTKYFYGLAVKDKNIYVADGGDFKSNGKLLVYNLATKKKIKDFSVSVGASKIYFN